jgi:hypothetical protein
MKKYIYIALIVTASLYTSCSKDYLDVIPDNVATIDNAFTNRFNAQKFLFTLYSALPDPGSRNNPALNGVDEIWYPKSEAGINGARIAQGFQNATSPYANRWQGTSNADLYVAIRNCNIFISRIDGVLGMNDFERKQWKAEAIFLKAYYHFYLVSMYGPIVLSDEAVPVTAATSNVKAVRNTVDECFTFIIDLLDKSMVDLPLQLQTPSEDLGRVSKSIVAAIKARVLITYASPLFNGNTVYSGFVNKEGVNLFPQQYDATKWEKAAIATKEAIDLCHEAGFRLVQKADYINPFPQNDITLLRGALRGRVTEKWNPEIVWGHTGNTSNIEFEAMPRLYGYTTNPVASRHCPPIGIAEMYYSKNGVPIEEDVNYDYGNRFKTRVSVVNDKYDVNVGSSTAILNFDRENRFYADLGFDRGIWFGNGKETTDTDPWFLRARKGEFASVFEISQYSVTGYWPKKLIGMKTQVKNGTDLSTKQYSFPIVRLADLYLYYAEALNEAKGAPEADVYQYIDLVRKRSGLGTVVDSWRDFSNNPGKPLTKGGMRDIIQQERMIEMSFEGTRFWDLRRWKLAKKYMNKPIKGWSVLENIQDNYYTVKVLFNPTFSEKDYLWPIPENEIIKNPSLIQNPGW